MKYVHYLFRLRSSRGTDVCHCLKLQAGQSKENIRYCMEAFAEKLTCNTPCHEYSVTYTRVKMLTREELLKKYKTACDRKNKANDNWSKLAAMLNPKELA